MLHAIQDEPHLLNTWVHVPKEVSDDPIAVHRGQAKDGQAYAAEPQSVARPQAQHRIQNYREDTASKSQGPVDRPRTDSEVLW